MAMFNLFHQAVAEEVIPAIHSDSGGRLPVVVAGASIGAFNSLAMICRYPHLVSSAICMSGTYTIEKDPTRENGNRVLMGPFTVYTAENVEAAAQ